MTTASLQIAPQIALLASRAVLKVEGEDWRSFLQGLLTLNAETLPIGHLAFGGMLTPQGKLLFDLFVLAVSETEALIDVATDRAQSLLMRLNLYRLRAKVKISATDHPVLALWGGHDALGPIDPRLATLGHRAYAPLDAPITATEADYHAHRIGLGVPDPDKDAPSETTYPIDANFDLLNGIDFKKGCFVGQETTSRMKRRGTIKNRMLPLKLASSDAIPFGSEILTQDKYRAGETLSQVGETLMAVVRLDRIESEGLHIELAGQDIPLTLIWPDYIPRV